MDLCQDPYPESASQYADSLYLCELQILGTLSGCDLIWTEEVEGEHTRAEERKKQEEELFPNLLYKLEVYRSKMAAFYANIAILHELRDMRIALQVGASDRSPLQFGVCLRSSENYLVNDLGWL